jgi:hypothetical protein
LNFCERREPKLEFEPRRLIISGGGGPFKFNGRKPGVPGLLGVLVKLGFLIELRLSIACLIARLVGVIGPGVEGDDNWLLFE